MAQSFGAVLTPEKFGVGQSNDQTLWLSASQMKKKLWIFAPVAGALIFFLYHYSQVENPELKNLRKVAEFSRSDPNIQWSKDGSIVKVQVVLADLRFFNFQTLEEVDQEETWQMFVPWDEPLYELRSNHSRFGVIGQKDSKIPILKTTALSICSRTGRCHLLPETPSKDFRIRDESFPGIDHEYSSSRISSDDRFVSIVGGGKLKTWLTNNGQLIRSTSLDIKGRILKSAIAPDMKSVVVLVENPEKYSDDGQMSVIEITGEKRQIKFPNVRSFDADFSPDQQLVWGLNNSVANKWTLTFYNPKNGKELWTCHPATSIAPIFTRNSKSLIVFGSKGLEIRDAKTGKIQHQIVGPTKMNRAFLSPTGSHLWTCDEERNIWSWHLSYLSSEVSETGSNAHTGEPIE